MVNHRQPQLLTIVTETRDHNVQPYFLAHPHRSCLTTKANPTLSPPTFPPKYTSQLFSNTKNLFHCFHRYHFEPHPPETESVCLMGWGRVVGGRDSITQMLKKGRGRKTPSFGLRRKEYWEVKKSRSEGWVHNGAKR